MGEHDGAGDSGAGAPGGAGAPDAPGAAAMGTPPAAAARGAPPAPWDTATVRAAAAETELLRGVCGAPLRMRIARSGRRLTHLCLFARAQRGAPGSPSFLERTQGITGTRKRLDDALARAPLHMAVRAVR